MDTTGIMGRPFQSGSAMDFMGTATLVAVASTLATVVEVAGILVTRVTANNDLEESSDFLLEGLTSSHRSGWIRIWPKVAKVVH